jgi:hypothetical protein
MFIQVYDYTMTMSRLIWCTAFVPIRAGYQTTDISRAVQLRCNSAQFCYAGGQDRHTKHTLRKAKVRLVEKIRGVCRQVAGPP